MSVTPELIQNALTRLATNMQVIVDAKIDSKSNVKRVRATAALMEVADFLNQLSPQGPYGNLFADIATALAQLDRGMVDPMLAPAAKEGSEVDVHSIWRARVSLVIAAEILYRGGYALPAACAAIVRLAPEIRNLRTGKGRTDSQPATLLKGWVERFRQGKAPRPDIKSQYETQLRELNLSINLIDSSNALQMAERYLRDARSGLIINIG